MNIRNPGAIHLSNISWLEIPRFWLIKWLAGNTMVIINARIGFDDRAEGDNIAETYGPHLISNNAFYVPDASMKMILAHKDIQYESCE